MRTNLIEDRSARQAVIEKPVWQSLGESAYQCQAILCPEEGGGFSAHAIRLPGVVSQGDSEDEAISNLAEAFTAAIQLYLEDTGRIPWRDAKVERKEGCTEKRILVNV